MLSPEGAAATYQEERIGLRTSDAWRLPASLLVSDLGMRGIPCAAAGILPEGAVCVQVVDCHLGYLAGEAVLVREGFGAARSWHYTALGEPASYLDGEGLPVQRWLRILVRKGPACSRVKPAVPGGPRFKRVEPTVWRG